MTIIVTLILVLLVLLLMFVTGIIKKSEYTQWFLGSVVIIILIFIVLTRASHSTLVSNPIKIDKPIINSVKCENCNWVSSGHYCPNCGEELEGLFCLQTKNKDKIFFKGEEVLDYDTVKTLYKIYKFNFFGRCINLDFPSYVSDTNKFKDNVLIK